MGGEEEDDFDRRLERSISQDTIGELLKKISRSRSITQARKIHSHILGRSLNSSTYLGNLLVVAYAKCGAFFEARKAFDSIPCKNIFSWTVLITGYAHAGRCREAIHSLREMDCDGEKPNEVTFLGLLVACSSAGDLIQGRNLHSRILLCGFDRQPCVGNALVSMYGRCSGAQEARTVFDKLPIKNIVSYNAMLKAYVQCGFHNEALELFDEIWSNGSVDVNAITFTTVVGACSDLCCLERGILIHGRIAGTGLESDVALGTALVNMYGKCGSVDRARTIFDSMTQKSVVTWSALIAAFSQNGYGREAFDSYCRMMREGCKPNEVTFLSVVSACSTMMSLAEGREVHKKIVCAGIQSLLLDNALLVMYIKCKSLREAESLFSSMKCRDLKSWLFMIAGYAQLGSPRQALQIFKEMNRVSGLEPDEVIYANVLTACSRLKCLGDGKAIHAQIMRSSSASSAVVGTALIDFYSNCGELGSARSAFGNICLKDVASWNAVIGACLQNQQSQLAVEAFHLMNLEGDCHPNHRTFVAVLEACTDTGAFAAGKRLYERIVAAGYELGVVLGTGIISMFGRCGELERGRDVFDRMQLKDLVTWTAMITAYTHNGVAGKAREIYETMAVNGLEPDEITFISILSSSAHSGLVDEGCEYCFEMSEDWGILPREEHFLCVIDMLGRAGRLSEAEEVVKMSSKQLGLVGWTSLLGCCRTQGDYERANRISEAVVKQDPKRSAPYVLLTQF